MLLSHYPAGEFQNTRCPECHSIFRNLDTVRECVKYLTQYYCRFNSRLLSMSSFQELIKMLEVAHFYFSKVFGQKSKKLLVIFWTGIWRYSGITKHIWLNVLPSPTGVPGIRSSRVLHSVFFLVLDNNILKTHT